MSEVLLVFQIILAVVLTIIVLLQKSSSIGLGAYGGGGNDSVFGAKGANSFLTKVTFTIGFLFVVNTVALTYMYNSSKDDSVVDMIEGQAPAAPMQTSAPQSSATPVAPVVPTMPSAAEMPSTEASSVVPTATDMSTAPKAPTADTVPAAAPVIPTTNTTN